MDENQHVGGTARNYEKKILTQPSEKNNITYQGMKRQTPNLAKNNKISQQYLPTVWMLNTKDI